jgi:polyhydroxybutyrate depolymerase
VTRLSSRSPDDPTWIERPKWAHGDEPVITLYVVHGGGHAVPQPAFRFPRLLGQTAANLNAAFEAVAFFRLGRAGARTASGAGCEGNC